MSKLRQIFSLHSKGKSKLQIHKFTGLSRNTVAKYLNVLYAKGLTQAFIAELDDVGLDKLFCTEPVEPVTERVQALYDYFDEHEKKLRRRGMTMNKLYGEYQLINSTGYRISAFYKHHKAWKRRHCPEMHVEHKAGDKMFVDFTGDKLPYIDSGTGQVLYAEVFVAILGASQLAYIEATRTQSMQDFIGACERALFYFGGAPLALVSDNLKAAVLKPNKFEPTLNENLEMFANHYNMSVLPARVRKPKDKSLVEGMVKISYRKVFVELPEEPTFWLKELNEHISVLLKRLNTENMSRRPYSRMDQFIAAEQSELQPLPKEAFALRTCRHATVQKNAHVCLTADKHYYSVPYEYIGKKTRLLYTESHVEIFYRYQLIAAFERSRKQFGFTTETKHLAPHHQQVSHWSPEYFLSKARLVDAVVEEYIRLVLEKKQHPEQAYRSCRGILSFEPRVGAQRLANACRRAHACQSYSYRTIRDILSKGLDSVELDQEHLGMPQHQNIRGKEYYEGIRSLSQTLEIGDEQ